MALVIDWDQQISPTINHKWFDKFDFPSCDDYKPPLYNQIANFSVDKTERSTGIAKRLISLIVKYYSYINIMNTSASIVHSQHLICGNGLFQIADPTWYKPMTKIGFKLRRGCESFYIDQDYDPLPPVAIYEKNHLMKYITNTSYNRQYGLDDIYNNISCDNNTTIHLPERIQHVLHLSKNPRAKLQYFQLYYDFIK